MSIRNLILLVFLLITTISSYNSGRYKTVLKGGGDSWGYYTYLPATFIYNDLDDLQSTLAVRQTYDRYTVRTDAEGLLRVTEAPAAGSNNVMKYTYGVSVFLAPAYFLAHLIASTSDTIPADGYSDIYVLFLFMIVILYVTIGLFYLAKFLDHYLDTTSVNYTLLTLAFATNLFYFSTINNVMSHPIQFMLWALLLYHSHNYFEVGRRWSSLIWMAFSIGFICIIRPVELFCVLIPLSYSLKDNGKGKYMISDFFTKSYYKHLVLAMMIGVIILLPQIVYWYTLTGSLIYDSYPSEKFNFSHPEIWNGLFSFRNGFFSYAPIMLLSIFGFFLGYRKSKGLIIAIAIIFALHIYISYSWWCWNYINGMGSRIMVDILPILALPLAYFISYISKFGKWIYLFIWMPFSCINLMYTWQAHNGIIYPAFGNAPFMLQTFGATEHTIQHSVAFDIGMYQYDDYQCQESFYKNDFEITQSQSCIKFIKSENSNFLAITDSIAQVFEKIHMSNDQLGNEDDFFHIRLDLDILVIEQVNEIWSSSILHIDYLQDGKIIGTRDIRLNNKTGENHERTFWWGKTDKKSHLTVYLDPKYYIEDGAEVAIYFYKPKGTPVIYIDNLEVALCER